jgi:NAD(P)-dependent dehydrogenase (short-subunit alcohol dehydrogenase family)
VNHLFRYDGRRVLVTGCSSGIGAATAAGAASLGAEVIGVDVKPPTVDLASFVPMDLGDPASIDVGVASIGAPVDALFNCAGLSNGAAEAARVMAVNFLGLRHLTEAVAARMVRGGAVASVASLGGLGWQANLGAVLSFLEIDEWVGAEAWCRAHPEQFEGGAYAFSKQAVIVYTKQRSIPWAAQGIRTNAIGPSPVDTPMLADTVKVVGQAYLDAFPRPLGRNSSAPEQASVLLFLNSDAASYVTGQLLWTDGGYTAGLVTEQLPSVVRTRAARTDRP